jgi:hypothetical protein
MSKRTRSTVVTPGVAAALTAALATASAAPAASPPSTPVVHGQSDAPVLVDCMSQPQERPADFLLACGDGNSRLVSLHWSRWDRSSAVARGVNMENDCEPACAVGKFHSYPVTVRLTGAQPWKEHPGLLRYTELSLVYTGGRPAGIDRVTHVPLWN